MIFISHDLTVINKIADRVVVMREGRDRRRSNKYGITTTSSSLYSLFIIN